MGYPAFPFSRDHVEKLVNDLGFPDRFFISQIVLRRLSAHTTTRTGDCWILRDWLFFAVTMQRTRNNDILSIIVSENRLKNSSIEPVLKRYISSKIYHRHPLFTIFLVADAALEDYRDASSDLLRQSEIADSVVDDIPQHGIKGFWKDPTAFLVDIKFRRTRLTRLSGDLKAFHASLRNLLNLFDRRDMNPGSLQSFSTQGGAQANSHPSSGLDTAVPC
jgi:hypothetical protein